MVGRDGENHLASCAVARFLLDVGPDCLANKEDLSHLAKRLISIPTLRLNKCRSSGPEL